MKYHIDNTKSEAWNVPVLTPPYSATSFEEIRFLVELCAEQVRAEEELYQLKLCYLVSSIYFEISSRVAMSSSNSSLLILAQHSTAAQDSYCNRIKQDTSQKGARTQWLPPLILLLPTRFPPILISNSWRLGGECIR